MHDIVLKQHRVTYILLAMLVVIMASIPAFAFADQDADQEPREQLGVSPLPMRTCELAPQATIKREIVCWGDSMTSGAGTSEAFVRLESGVYDASYKSYPDILEDFTGLPVYNFGVSSATSLEIAIMQGAIPYRSIEGVEHYDERVVRHSIGHPGDVLVLEIGSNGGWDNDYTVLIEQYRAMIDHAGTQDFLVLGDTDDPGSSPGDLNQLALSWDEEAQETDWERALREEFGDRFVNVRLYLLEHGLADNGLEPTEEDEEQAHVGCISAHLRSDWTHLNSHGYFAKAKAVYERGVALGYWR